MLLLLAGVVNKNLGRLAEALGLYKSAIHLDPDQLRAWQGAFEIISHPEWKIVPGEFDVSIVEKLIAKYVPLLPFFDVDYMLTGSFSSTDPQKLSHYQRWRTKLLLQTRQWNRLLAEESGFDGETLIEAARVLLSAFSHGRDQGGESAVPLVCEVHIVRGSQCFISLGSEDLATH